ncbi:MAG: hypothetical protein HYX81_00385, partial [Chloroflexi bacterium]|nr:hypothetical protein [Chloroflexota bacterium]
MVSKTETAKTPEELYQEREKRITDAIQLRVPDRVPVILLLGYFPAKYAGITCEAAYYDAAEWKRASRKVVQELEPDCYALTGGTTSGVALEALDAQQIRWPGHGVSPYYSHQMIELEPMKADEYDAFFADPSDFIMRVYLPRVWGITAPFGKLPPLATLIGGTTLAATAGQLAAPDFVATFAAFAKAAEASAKWHSEMSPFAAEMEGLGFPGYHSVTTSAPFDVVSDNLRGMRGTMIDMYKY